MSGDHDDDTVAIDRVKDRFLAYCSEGDVDPCKQLLNSLKSHLCVALDDLIGAGFSRAAQHNQIVVLEFLASSCPEVLRDGVCHSRTLFPPTRYSVEDCDDTQWIVWSASFRYVVHGAIAAMEAAAAHAFATIVHTLDLLHDTELLFVYEYGMHRSLTLVLSEHVSPALHTCEAQVQSVVHHPRLASHVLPSMERLRHSSVCPAMEYANRLNNRTEDHEWAW